MISPLSPWYRNAFRFDAATKPPTFFISRWLFLRLLGVVYLAAFVSLGVQIRGLIGSQGVLPVADYLTAIREAIGSERYYLAPTWCWLNSGDPFLVALCAGGAVLSILLIAGVAPALILLVLWSCYLSLTVVGQIFVGYQWDGLLLETGFLAVFLAPLQLWPRRGREAPPARAIVWLLRWLLFRLMFASGVAKLLSGDESWWSLRALHYHYQTQPLPTWTSWYMQQLPGWFQQLSVLGTFFVELLLPLLLFGPRRGRHLACISIVTFQLLIAATGNYGFFNLLAIVLCLPLVEDAAFPARLQAHFIPAGESANDSRHGRWSRWISWPVAAGILLMSAVPFLHNTGLVQHWPTWLNRVHQAVASFRSINSYGLFAVMTTRRPEILVEGSDDGQTWTPYEFRWKPGDPLRRPRFTGLHMPRLDWQMWFAALRSFREEKWFIQFLGRVLEGSPEVLGLLDRNPFPDRPPRYVRAVLYEYRFTDFATRAQTGRWWRREVIRLYCPILSRKEPANDLRPPLP